MVKPEPPAPWSWLARGAWASVPLRRKLLQDSDQFGYRRPIEAAAADDGVAGHVALAVLPAAKYDGDAVALAGAFDAAFVGDEQASAIFFPGPKVCHAANAITVIYVVPQLI